MLSSSTVLPACAASIVIIGFDSIRSTIPLYSRLSPEAEKENNENFIVDEPELITKIASIIFSSSTCVSRR